VPSLKADTVWLISCTEGACLAASEALQRAGASFDRPVVFEHTALASPDPQRSDPSDVPQHPRLRGVVLILERAALTHPAFEQWARWCCDRAEEREDFRVFVRLHGLAARDLPALAARHPVVALLHDTVQIVAAADADHLRRALGELVVDAALRRRRAVWRRWSQAARVGAGFVAAVVLVALVIAALVSSLRSVWGWLGVPWAGTLAGPWRDALVGASVFPIVAPLLWLLSRRGLPLEEMMRPGRRAMHRDTNIRGLAAAITGIGLWGVTAWSWAALGLAVGVLLDVVRRAGWAARRERIALAETLADSASQRRVWNLFTAAARDLPFGVRCPVLADDEPRIFISYSRTSEWGAALARDLAMRLLQREVEFFLDLTTLSAGASWRRELQERLALANVVVFIADQDSGTRPWTTAELTAVLEARALTGSPRLIVVRSYRLRARPATAAPILRALAADPDLDPTASGPLFLDETDDTADMLMSELMDDRSELPPALLPRSLSRLLLLAMTPLFVVCATASAIGCLALIAPLLEPSLLPSWHARFAESRLWGAALVVAALGLGCSARAILDALVGMRAGVLKALCALLSCAGLTYVLVGAVERSSPLLLAWLAAAVPMGWLLFELCAVPTRLTPQRGLVALLGPPPPQDD